MSTGWDYADIEAPRRRIYCRKPSNAPASRDSTFEDARVVGRQVCPELIVVLFLRPGQPHGPQPISARKRLEQAALLTRSN